MPSPAVLAIAAPFAAVMIEYGEHPYRRLPPRWVPEPLELHGALAAKLFPPPVRRVDRLHTLAPPPGGPGSDFEPLTRSVHAAMGLVATNTFPDRGTLSTAVQGAVGRSMRRITREVPWELGELQLARNLEEHWHRYLGSQFSVAGWLGHRAPDLLSYYQQPAAMKPNDGQLRLCDPGPSREVPIRLESARAFEAMAGTACCWWPHEAFVMACEHPTALHTERVDDATSGRTEERLHCEDGPAALWPDGWSIHSLHGVTVPACVVERPETLTAYDALRELDGDVRRAMIDRIGTERFLGEALTELVDDDPEWGKLWRLPPMYEWRPELLMVECVNATPEPDGTFKHYLLEVPPDCRTARQALAWTFDLESAAYIPDAQT